MVRSRETFHVQLEVWVLGKGDIASRWRVCELSPTLGEELIQHPSDVRAVLGAQGRLVSLLMAKAGTEYTAFRILARRTDTGDLSGMTEWQTSAETGALLLCAGFPWSASDDLRMAA